MEKTCTECGVVKPLDAYCKHPRGLNGRASQCKECDKLYRKQPQVVAREKLRHKKDKRTWREKRLNKDTYKAYWDKQKQTLSDLYIIDLLRSRTNVSAKSMRSNPSLIESYRKLVILKGMVSSKYIDKNESKRMIDLRYKLKRKIINNPTHPKIAEWKYKLAIANGECF